MGKRVKVLAENHGFQEKLQELQHKKSASWFGASIF
jgi:hypothetical protein